MGKPGRFSRGEGAKLINLWFAGARMANVCFNLKQDATLTVERRETLRECQEDWDKREKAAHRLLREARKALGVARKAARKGRNV